MINMVERNVRERSVDASVQDINTALNREIIPTLRDVRAQLNKTIASVSFEMTQTVTSDYIATFSEFIKVDPSGGIFVVTLPAPSEDVDGETVVLKNVTVSATAVEVVSEGGALVETASSHFVSGALFSARFICDFVGNCWWQI